MCVCVCVCMCIYVYIRYVRVSEFVRGCVRGGVCVHIYIWMYLSINMH